MRDGYKRGGKKTPHNSAWPFSCHCNSSMIYHSSHKKIFFPLSFYLHSSDTEFPHLSVTMYSLLSELFFQSWHPPPDLVIPTSYSNLWTKHCATCVLLWAFVHRLWRTKVLRTKFLPRLHHSASLSQPQKLISCFTWATSSSALSRDIQELVKS